MCCISVKTKYHGTWYRGDVFNTRMRCRYAPVMRPAAVWWRWLSSLVAQDSFVHLAANALLFGGLGLHLERRYGTARIVLLALICGLAGNFLDSAVMVHSQADHA